MPEGLPPAEPKPVFAATRLGAVSVFAPYDQQSFAVKRADGSMAFDPENRFAAQPAALLKGVLMASLAADGRFGHVVPQSSIVTTTVPASPLKPDNQVVSIQCAAMYSDA